MTCRPRETSMGQTTTINVLAAYNAVDHAREGPHGCRRDERYAQQHEVHDDDGSGVGHGEPLCGVTRVSVLALIRPWRASMHQRVCPARCQP